MTSFHGCPASFLIMGILKANGRLTDFRYMTGHVLNFLAVMVSFYKSLSLPKIPRKMLTQ